MAQKRICMSDGGVEKTLNENLDDFDLRLLEDDLMEMEYSHKTRALDSLAGAMRPTSYQEQKLFSTQKKRKQLMVPLKLSSDSLSESESESDADENAFEPNFCKSKSTFQTISSKSSSSLRKYPWQMLARKIFTDDQFDKFNNQKQSGTLGKDQFSNLPEEMILRILKLLPQNCLGRISQVSKQFNRLTRDESLWRRMDIKGKFISRESINSLLFRKPVYLRLAGATVLEQTSLEKGLVAPQLVFLDLSAATISDGVLSQLLKICISLEKLSLENLEISSETLVSMQVFAHSVETLNLTMCSGRGIESLHSGYLVKCKRLKELNVGCIKQSWTKDDFLNFVYCLPTTLEKLNVSGFRNILHDKHVDVLAQRCSNLSHLDLSDCVELTARSLLVIPCLRRLHHLSLTRCFGIPPAAYALLIPMKSLTYLDIFTLFKDEALELIVSFLPKVIINKHRFSTIARPTIGTSQYSIWSQLVRK